MRKLNKKRLEKEIINYGREGEERTPIEFKL